MFTYRVRWYSEETSKYWIGDFKPSTEVGVDMIIWLIVLPFASFILHSVSLHINLFRKQTCQYKRIGRVFSHLTVQRVIARLCTRKLLKTRLSSDCCFC